MKAGIYLGKESIEIKEVPLPEDVYDIQEIMACEKWNLESIISHEFPLEQLEEAIRTAADVKNSGNVVIRMLS